MTQTTPIPIGVFANHFRYSTIEEVFDAVKSHGVDLVEFCMSCLGLPETINYVDDSSLHRVKAAAEERGLKLYSLATYFNMIHPDPEQRKALMKHLAEHMRAANILGIKVISLCTGSRDPDSCWSYHPGNREPDAYEDLLASMNEALRLAEQHDLILGFEPEVNLVVDTTPKSRQLLDDMKSERLKVIFDGANLYHEGELAHQHRLLKEGIDSLGNDFIIVHAKDIAEDGHEGNMAAGKGKLDYPFYMGLLKAIDFPGPIILHQFQEADVDYSLDHVRNSLN